MIASESLPPRERGLKLKLIITLILQFVVAPSAGAWIEIKMRIEQGHLSDVAPSAGAWIEITTFDPALLRTTVAPSAGAWIEMVSQT